MQGQNHIKNIRITLNTRRPTLISITYSNLLPTPHKTISPLDTNTKTRKLMLFSKIIRVDSEKCMKQINGLNEHNAQPLTVSTS